MQTDFACMLNDGFKRCDLTALNCLLAASVFQHVMGFELLTAVLKKIHGFWDKIFGRLIYD